MRWLLLVPWVLACASGGDDTAAACTEAVQYLLPTDRVGLFDFSAQQLLLEVEGTRVLPASGLGELTLDVAYEGGLVRFVQATGSAADSGEPFGCGNRIEVEVVVGLSTADEGLAERWKGLLWAVEGDRAWLRASSETAEGSWEPTGTAVLDVELTADAASGTLSDATGVVATF